VEKFAGISGNRDGLPQVPDGEFLPPMEMTCLEKYFKKSIEGNFPGRNRIISRTANLSRAINGRGPCQYRDLCFRGCPFGLSPLCIRLSMMKKNKEPKAFASSTRIRRKPRNILQKLFL
jgi:hypothetical protein